MSWYTNLATKVIPKVMTKGAEATSSLWKGGTTLTSALWKGGSTVTNAGWQATKAVTSNPKTAAAVAIGGWAAIKSVQEPDKSLGTHVGETLRGNVDGAGGFAHDVVNGFTGKDTVESVTETAGNMIDKTTETLSDIKSSVTESKGLLGSLGDSLKGISNFIGNIFGGNGTDMFSNFFNNFASGKVSGLGIGALILGGYMMFGRTGLLGKIGGALLAMMMIGSNSQQQSQTVAQTVPAQNQEQEQSRGMHR